MFENRERSSDCRTSGYRTARHTAETRARARGEGVADERAKHQL